MTLEEKPVAIVLLLTAGLDWSTLRPNGAGVSRCIAAGSAVKMFMQGGLYTPRLIVVGGYPGVIDDGGNRLYTLAGIHAAEFIRLYPEYQEAVAIIDGSQDATVDDIPAGFQAYERRYGPLPKDVQIYCASYDAHTQRAGYSIAAMGFTNFQERFSGETPMYPPAVDAAVNCVTRFDRRWRWPLGWILRWLANRQAEKHRQDFAAAKAALKAV